MSFTNQVVWITGASSGIGEALAMEFSRYGARVVLSARRADELERVRQGLVWPENHLVLTMDMTKSSEIEEAVEQVRSHFGRLDILVNNAGISQRSLALDTDMAANRRVMEINYFGVIGLTKAVLPWFRQQRSGQIVVISSLVGELPTPLRSAYCASKHALHGWFESLRAEEHDNGLKILMVLPGFIRTQISVNAITADGSAHGKMDQLQAQGMPAEECAERIIYALQHNRAQAIIAGREGLAIYLKRWFPSLYRFIIRRIKVT